MNTSLDMLTRDAHNEHIHMVNLITKYRIEILPYAKISDANLSSIKELAISHLHSFLGIKGYIRGIRVMSADERTSACEKGYANVIGAISVEERTTAGLNG